MRFRALDQDSERTGDGSQFWEGTATAVLAADDSSGLEAAIAFAQKQSHESGGNVPRTARQVGASVLVSQRRFSRISLFQDSLQ